MKLVTDVQTTGYTAPFTVISFTVTGAVPLTINRLVSAPATTVPSAVKGAATVPS